MALDPLLARALAPPAAVAGAAESVGRGAGWGAGGAEPPAAPLLAFAGVLDDAPPPGAVHPTGALPAVHGPGAPPL